jgi:hypothetical protein
MRTKLRALAALLVLAAWTRADAFPAFARKYGMSCSACHDAWPILNAVGVNFRDNGYQFRLGKDAPTELRPEYIPIALRSVPQYAFTRTTNQTSDGGPVTVRTGGIDVPGVDILTGGAISEGVSFLLVVAGFTDGEPGVIESGWARINRIGGTGWLNLRIGKMELDLPASAHRGIALTSPYAVYGAHPMGSAVGLDLSENQVGLELSGHDERSYTRYALSLTNTNGGMGLSSGGWSSPLVYGHVQQTFAMESAILPFVRIGALGALGWWPTAFATAGGEPIPGTYRDHRQFYRVGGELSATLGYPATPFIVTAAYQHGSEAAGLSSAVDPVSGVDLSTVANTFNGAFVEVDWVPYTVSTYVGTPWVLFAKYDVIRFERGAGDLDGATFGVRRYLAMSPAAAAAIHAEVHLDRVRGVGWVDPTSGIGREVVTQSAILGIDFDF